MNFKMNDVDTFLVFIFFIRYKYFSLLMLQILDHILAVNKLTKH